MFFLQKKNVYLRVKHIVINSLYFHEQLENEYAIMRVMSHERPVQDEILYFRFDSICFRIRHMYTFMCNIQHTYEIGWKFINFVRCLIIGIIIKKNYYHDYYHYIYIQRNTYNEAVYLLSRWLIILTVKWNLPFSL